MPASTSRSHRATSSQAEANVAATLKAQGHTLLLRAILGASPAIARTAWGQWLDAVGDPVAHLRQDTNGLRRLSPLLLTAIRRNDLPADCTFLTVLKSAYFREELRDGTYRHILGSVLSALYAEGIEAILINGAALAHSVYPEPMLRHCHNIDLYCNGGHVEQAAELLSTLGCRETARDMEVVGFEHDSGLPVELHRQLLGADDAPQRFPVACERARWLEIDGHPVRILAPEDALVQICAHGVSDSVAPHPGLACDAWMQIERGPELDRDRLHERADGTGLAKALKMMLACLSQIGAGGPVTTNTVTITKHGIS